MSSGPAPIFHKPEPNPYSKHLQPLPTVPLPRYLRKKEPLRFAYVSEQAAGLASAYYIVHVNVSNIKSRNSLTEAHKQDIEKVARPKIPINTYTYTYTYIYIYKHK